MNHYLLDLKASFLSVVFFAITFAEVEVAMKIIVFVITCGYTIHRWLRFFKNKDAKE